MLSLGVIGEYIGKIYMEVKARPRHIIEKILETQKNVTRVELSSAWNAYGAYNRRDEGMATFWVRPVVEFLEREICKVPISEKVTILDFGCSYFDLGCQLKADVDGYDPDPLALRVATKRLLEHPARRAFLTSQRDEIPQKKYDWIVANSVIQYFTESDDLENFLADSIEKWSRNGHPNILISDVIPMEYLSWVDAAENFIVAIRNGFAFPMLRHLCRAALKPRTLSLRKYSLEGMARVASAHGMQTKCLATNLTPSKQRFSILLTPIR